MSKNKRVLSLILFGIFCCYFSYAQESNNAQPTIEEVVEVVAEPDSADMVEVSLGVEVEEEAANAEFVDFSCVDMALPQVIQLFTRVSGANIVATTTEELEAATVTVELKQVHWKDALQSILHMHNYELVQENQDVEIYAVSMRKPDALPPLAVETLFFKYTTADEMFPIVQNLLIKDTRAKISIFESRNAMVVQSTEDNIRDMKVVLESIDIPGSQVSVETKFIELSDGASKQLGIKWDSLEEFGVGLSAGPFSYARTETVDNNTANGNADWDIRRRSDVLTESADYGGDYNTGDFDVNSALTGFDGDLSPSTIDAGSIESPFSLIDSIDSGQDIISDNLGEFAESIVQSQAAILSVDSLNLVLSALQGTEGVSMISNPKILVASGNKDARFTVGTQEPIIKTTIQYGTTDSPGDKVTAELDTGINTDYISQGYMRTGIELSVIPFVKTDKYIQAEITPSLIRKTDEKVVGDNSWPIISVKEIKTLFTLKSGQTVAIGGLTSSTEEDEVTKIPFLGDIPFIGKYLFSHSKTSTSQNETIIFVTLSIADPDLIEENQGVPQDSELIYKRLLKEQLDRKEFEKEYLELKKATDEKIMAVDESIASSAEETELVDQIEDVESQNIENEIEQNEEAPITSSD
jgi:type II secretory pathway component GspD/PulD (secretin)